MRNAVRLFLLNFVQYCVIAANTRTVAQGHYLASFATDLLCAGIGFTITKKIVDAKTWTDRAGYALGGACGAQLAIYLTKVIFGA